MCKGCKVSPVCIDSYNLWNAIARKSIETGLHWTELVDEMSEEKKKSCKYYTPSEVEN